MIVLKFAYDDKNMGQMDWVRNYLKMRDAYSKKDMETILKLEYSKYATLSVGPNLSQQDTIEIDKIYSYLNVGDQRIGAQLRRLVGDCIGPPKNRLSASELLRAHFP